MARSRSVGDWLTGQREQSGAGIKPFGPDAKVVVKGGVKVGGKKLRAEQAGTFSRLTVAPLDKRKSERRKRNKAAKLSRRQNRG